MIVIINACKSMATGSSLQEDALLHFLTSLGYDPLNPPLADLLRRYHRLAGDWLIVSPIHWQASHNNAEIVAMGPDLQWSEIQAKQSFTLFAEHLAADGMVLHYHSPSIWLLRVDDKPPLSAKPVQYVLNKPFMQELAALGKELYWQKFITESQMLFSTQTDTLLNGVWLWSTSKLKEQTIKVAADTFFYPMVEVSQVKAIPYAPSLSLHEIDVLLLDRLESLSQAHQKKIKKMPSTWYWNDEVQIQGRSPNILVRLWRKLIHAH